MKIALFASSNVLPDSLSYFLILEAGDKRFAEDSLKCDFIPIGLSDYHSADSNPNINTIDLINEADILVCFEKLHFELLQEKYRTPENAKKIDEAIFLNYSSLPGDDPDKQVQSAIRIYRRINEVKESMRKQESRKKTEIRTEIINNRAMSKIKILAYCGDLNHSGTCRSMERIINYLKEGSKYDFFILYPRRGNNDRIAAFEDMLGTDKLFSFDASNEIVAYQTPKETDIWDVLSGATAKHGQFDIFHVFRPGYNCFPVVDPIYYYCKKIIETNTHGFYDDVSRIDYSIAVSEFIYRKRFRNSKFGDKQSVIYNPTLQPAVYHDRSRKEPFKKITFGFIQRENNFDPIALDAFHIFKHKFPEIESQFKIVNPSPDARYLAENRYRVDDVIVMPLLSHDWQLQEFYESIDIYADSSIAGQHSGSAIQQAMMNGVPVITHQSDEYNTQEEIILPDIRYASAGGILCQKTINAYFLAMTYLMNHEAYTHYSVNAYAIALRNYDVAVTANKYSEVYQSVHSS